MAKAHGKPLVLLPAVVLARFQHPHSHLANTPNAAVDVIQWMARATNDPVLPIMK
jgi:hypothetical protein